MNHQPGLPRILADGQIDNQRGASHDCWFSRRSGATQVSVGRLGESGGPQGVDGG